MLNFVEKIHGCCLYDKMVVSRHLAMDPSPLLPFGTEYFVCWHLSCACDPVVFFVDRNRLQLRLKLKWKDTKTLFPLCWLWNSFDHIHWWICRLYMGRSLPMILSEHENYIVLCLDGQKYTYNVEWNKWIK